MSEVVTTHFDGEIVWITINNPPVNATSTAVRAGLLKAVEEIGSARYAVISCAGRTFVAGGDMSEFDAPPALPHLPDVYQAIENSPAIFIALMHGNVLGGGFELALACDFRIADSKTRFGLPEVNVGLIPGAAGTQRLPRLIGLEASIDVACSGKMLTATDLKALGGLDVLTSDDLSDAAKDLIATNPIAPTPISQRIVAPMSADALEEKRAALTKRAKGQQSPLLNLEALLWSLEPFGVGQPKERERHLALRHSPESRALRHAFFSERNVARPAAIKDATARDISKIAIVGGGLMGAGIATACLTGNYEVIIIERDEDAASSASERVIGLVDGALKRGKISQETRDAQLAKFSTSASYSDTKDCDLAVEAVFEDLDVKRQVFASLAAHMADDAILATNTSYLDPEAIFDGIENPSRCLGLHFFSPAHVMKLLEIVQTPSTSAEVLATGFAMGKRLKKISVLSGICDGFIGNRMLAAYRREADYLLADGAMPHEIDAAMRAFGMPMGPYELGDLTGLQIAWANRKRQAPTRPDSERYVTIADQLCALERFGQRSGKGWYRYEEGNRKPIVDPEVEAIILGYSAEQGITRRSFSAEDISSRLMAVLANEGASIIAEGIAENASAVDMVKIYGYGYPRWRGGPMNYAKEIGWEKTAEIMQTVASESPDSWALADFSELD